MLKKSTPLQCWNKNHLLHGMQPYVGLLAGACCWNIACRFPLCGFANSISKLRHGAVSNAIEGASATASATSSAPAQGQEFLRNIPTALHRLLRGNRGRSIHASSYDIHGLVFFRLLAICLNVSFDLGLMVCCKCCFLSAPVPKTLLHVPVLLPQGQLQTLPSLPAFLRLLSLLPLCCMLSFATLQQ